MNFCPGYIHLRGAKYYEDKGKKEEFFPDIYELIEDPKIGRLKAIRANTPNKVSIRIFACKNVKGQPKNYCDTLYDPEAKIKICELESDRPQYVFFYVDESKNEERQLKPIVYLLVFTRDVSDKEMKKLVAEVKLIANQLGITNNIIHCYLFWLSKYPQCGIMNDGTIKKRFEEYADKNYKCLPKSLIPYQWLYVNEGSKKFTFKPQLQK
jgi:hypothetical protein